MLSEDDILGYTRNARIIEKEYYDFSSTQTKLSPLKALALLSGEHEIANIGKSGPVMASVSLDDDVPYRALHLYETLFGRDSLIVADFLLDFFPLLAESTIVLLASLQGTRRDDNSEEEPGRILHEYRDPDSDFTQTLIKENGWKFPYYGTVDATPLFITLIYNYYCRVDKHILQKRFLNKENLISTVGDALENAVAWLVNRLDQNPEAILECYTTNPHGIRNQVWKDSFDSYFHRDGSLPGRNSLISSVELGGLAYDALLHGAYLLEVLASKTKDEKAQTSLLSKKDQAIAHAHTLRRSILSNFVKTDSLGSYLALGSERVAIGTQLKTFDVISSNMGEVLDSHLLTDRSPQIQTIVEGIVKHIFGDELLSPSGIRTLGTSELRYNPGAYHNGSIWPWENYIIARGLRRHGYNVLASYLEDTIVRVCAELKLYPEFIRGEDNKKPKINHWYIKLEEFSSNFVHTVEQPPQLVQGWTVAALAALQLTDRPKGVANPLEIQLLRDAYHKL